MDLRIAYHLYIYLYEISSKYSFNTYFNSPENMSIVNYSLKPLH